MPARGRLNHPIDKLCSACPSSGSLNGHDPVAQCRILGRRSAYVYHQQGLRISDSETLEVTGESGTTQESGIA